MKRTKSCFEAKENLLVKIKNLNYNTQMKEKGNLYVVATPIGNLQDVTYRAVDVLKTVDFIVCEDTRVTSRLLNKFSIKKPLIALNDFNEEQMTHSILKKLENESAALVSDSGTPLISDPGYRLVKMAKENDLKVIPIPGPSALITALSASGFATDKFVFLGFLPKSSTKTVKLLEVYKPSNQTIILYESPHRVLSTLKNIKEVFGNTEIVIARELTKIHEEILSMKVDEFLEKFNAQKPKGEFVILIGK